MKAREYYNKYAIGLMNETFKNPDERTVLWDVIFSFLNDTSDLIKARHCVKPEAVRAIITEQNNKWNTLCALFIKNGWRCPLKKDGFLEYSKTKLPEIF